MGGRLLTIGTGFDPYGRHLRDFRHYVRSDVSVVDGVTNVVMDGCASCFNSNSFDVVFITEVIEHVLEPSILIEEVYHLLRPGGMLYISAPFMYPIHGESGDYWRFTAEGLAYLFRRFRNVTVTAHGAVPQAVVDIISVGWRRRIAAVLRLVTPLLSASVMLRAGAASRAPVGYSVTAYKPTEAEVAAGGS